MFFFDKLTGNHAQSSVQDLGLEKQFYDLGLSVDLEKFISKNESNLRAGLDELVQKKNVLSISTDSRARISTFVALQYLRTREFREVIKAASGELLTAILNNEPKFRGKGIKVTMKEEAAQALQASLLVDDTVPRTASIIFGLSWTLLINRTSLPFWTSDNPVALVNPRLQGPGSVGLLVSGNQLHFPLAPGLVLLVYDSVQYRMPPLRLVKTDHVTYENNLQLYNSSRFVYSSEDNFSRALRIWHADESLKKPQKRVMLSSIPTPRSILFVIQRNQRAELHN